MLVSTFVPCWLAVGSRLVHFWFHVDSLLLSWCLAKQFRLLLCERFCCWFSGVLPWLDGLPGVGSPGLLLLPSWFPVCSLLVHCWFTVAFLLAHSNFAAVLPMVLLLILVALPWLHGWFGAGSLLVRGWFAVGSRLVSCRFPAGSLLLSCWLQQFRCCGASAFGAGSLGYESSSTLCLEHLPWF